MATTEPDPALHLAPESDHPRLLGYGLALFTVMVWAGFVIVSRMGGTSALTVWDIVALRFGVAGLILLPFLLRRGLPGLRWREIAALVACAGIGYALLVYGAFFFAPAQHGAILLSGLLPFTTTVLSLWLLREKVRPLRLLGLALICLGALPFVASAFNGSQASDLVWLGDLMLVAASFSWALFTVLIKRWQVRALDVTLIVTVFSMLLYLPVYFAFLPKQIAVAPLGEILLQAVYQGVIVVCVAMLSYTMAVELLGASRTAMIMALVPASGALLAVPLLGEPLTQAMLIGITLVTAGAILGALGRTERARPALKAHTGEH